MSIISSDCTLSVDEIINVATAVAGRWTLAEVIQSVSGDVVSFLTHDHFDAAILLEDGQLLQTFETGLNTEWGGATRSVSDSPIREIFLNNVEYIVTPDAHNDKQFQKEGMYTAPIFKANLRARLHVAMLISGKVIGALSFSRTTTTAYTKNDIANALVISRIISPYAHGLLQSDQINQARLAAEREAQLREGLLTGAKVLAGNLEKNRAQMGMELHDQTLADLSRISRTLQDKEKLNVVELSELKSDVIHCLTELRRIVDAARPSVLELFGLAEAVRHLVEKESAIRPNTELTFEQHLPETVSAYSDDIEFGFYRIAQEAIHNAFKHSGASRIHVELFEDNESMALSVVDNGCGLERSQEHNRGGLFNMQTRAALFGARLEIDSVEPSGTRVFLTAPIT